MKRVIFLCAFLTGHLISGAACGYEKSFYIFNITERSPLFLRLRTEDYPHHAFRPLTGPVTALTEGVYTLPATSCIQVLHDLESYGRLRLRLWPEEFKPDPFEPAREQYAFKGKLIPPGGNIILLCYLSEWKKWAATLSASKGYIIKSKVIPKQTDTAAEQALFALRTSENNISKFKEDLKDVMSRLYPYNEMHGPPSFETIAQFSEPWEQLDSIDDALSVEL